MPVKQLAHVCLNVKDLALTVDFYTRILGLGVKFMFRKDGRDFGAYFDAGNGTFIEAFQDSSDLPAKSHMVHLCLQVDDLRKTVAAIKAGGAEISEPKLGCDQSWQAWTTDPDGVQVELHEYTAESSQVTGKDLSVNW